MCPHQPGRDSSRYAHTTLSPQVLQQPMKQVSRETLRHGTIWFGKRPSQWRARVPPPACWLGRKELALQHVQFGDDIADACPSLAVSVAPVETFLQEGISFAASRIPTNR